MVDNPVFFLHIPKTGGQALAQRLSSGFAPIETAMPEPELRFSHDLPLLSSLLRSKKFIASHVQGELLAHRPTCDVVTAVRDPLAQIVSNYLHILREPANIWHRAAHSMSPEQFFDKYSDDFADHQCRYLISAFYPFDEYCIKYGVKRTIHSLLYETCDRIRWIFPTDQMDLFCYLWQIESKRYLVDANATKNIANRVGLDIDRLDRIVENMPHLYRYDSVLYEIAREKLYELRQRTLEGVIGRQNMLEYGVAFSEGADRINLLNGWHTPEIGALNELQWWSGPGRVSWVAYRNQHRRPMSFTVSVVNGITPNDIRAYPATGGDPIAMVLTPVSDDVISYRLDMSALPVEGKIRLIVPHCRAPIMISSDNSDTERKAFLASNWLLA